MFNNHSKALKALDSIIKTAQTKGEIKSISLDWEDKFPRIDGWDKSRIFPVIKIEYYHVPHITSGL